MQLTKDALYKNGDKIRFKFEAPLNKGLGYGNDVWYEGVILEHHVDAVTRVEITIDDGSKLKTETYYNDFNAGMESIELLVSDEELQKRLQEWIDKAVAEETERYNNRLEVLKSVTIR